MKKARPSSAAKKNTSACLTLRGRCYGYTPDSESEGEEEREVSASHRNIKVSSAPDSKKEISEFVDPIPGDNELDINPSSASAVRYNDQRTTLKRGLSLRGQQALTESITGLGIDDEIKEGLIRNANGLFEFTSLLEEKARGLGSQFLGLQDSDEESESVGDSSDDKSAELTPRLNRVDFQESVVNEQSLVSEFDSQTSRVTERPSPAVIKPSAQKIGDVELEDPNFPNALKIKAFDYINQACGFGLDIEEEEKIKYFNICLDMSGEKKEKILEAYNNTFKYLAANSLIIVDGSQISKEEKIQLFNLLNKKIELPLERNSGTAGEMNQLIFILKALKMQKEKIINGIEKRIRPDEERPRSPR
jgi:hypothetical protein